MPYRGPPAWSLYQQWMPNSSLLGLWTDARPLQQKLLCGPTLSGRCSLFCLGYIPAEIGMDRVGLQIVMMPNLLVRPCVPISSSLFGNSAVIWTTMRTTCRWSTFQAYFAVCGAKPTRLIKKLTHAVPYGMWKPGLGMIGPPLLSGYHHAGRRMKIGFRRMEVCTMCILSSS